MAFIVEDGSIVANANSYVSIADAKTYFKDRGDTAAWVDAYEVDQKAALIYATTWLDQNISWYSTIEISTQNLGYPRASYSDSDGRTLCGEGVMPQKVKDATCELAVQWLTENFNDASSEGVKSESIGSSSITYGSGSGGNKRFTFVRSLIRDYGKGNSITHILERA